MNIQWTLRAVFVAFVALLLSACGGASQSADNATSASQATSATSADNNTATSTGSSTAGAPVSCAAQDANAEGNCEAYFGVAWNGSECVGLSGCSCAGADCGNLATSQQDCVAAHAHCAH